MRPKAKVTHRKIKAPLLTIRVRTYTVAESRADVWLVARDGAAQWSVLHGRLLPQALEQLAAWAEELGIPVEREQSPWDGEVARESIKDVPKATGGLFKEQADG